MFVTIYFENVLQFCGIWKKYCLRSLTLGAIGSKTWFFKMWPKSMHDQKFGTFYSLRPEDGLYGSNEPKKCEIRPVVSSIVHFKVFKSYFIYITSRNPCQRHINGIRFSSWTTEFISPILFSFFYKLNTICHSYNLGHFPTPTLLDKICFWLLKLSQNSGKFVNCSIPSSEI